MVDDLQVEVTVCWEVFFEPVPCHPQSEKSGFYKVCPMRLCSKFGKFLLTVPSLIGIYNFSKMIFKYLKLGLISEWSPSSRPLPVYSWLAHCEIDFVMFSLFRDGPEYIQRTQTPFKPTKVNMACVHSGCYHFKANLCCRWLYPKFVPSFPKPSMRKILSKHFDMCFATFFAPSLFTNLDGWLILSLALWSRILDSPQSLELSLTGLPGPSIGTVRVLSLPDGGVWLMKQDTVHFLPTAGLTILLDSHCIPWGLIFHQMGWPYYLTAYLVYSRTILLLEIDPPCSPQGDDVHWTWRKLCSSNTRRLRTPLQIFSYILGLPWYFRGNADLYSHSHGFYATSWLAILPSHKCHGLTYVSFWYECG